MGGLARLLFPLATALYAAFLGAVLLNPYDFEAPTASNSARWDPAEQTLQFPATGLAISAQPPRAFYQAMRSGGGFSLVAILAAGDPRRHRQSVILSSSFNDQQRNFSLVQRGADLFLRLRTSLNRLDAKRRQVRVRQGAADQRLRHFVLSLEGAVWRVYINGKLRQTLRAAGGNLSNWDTRFPIVIGNEADGSQPWRGILRYAAVYRYALNAAAAQRLYQGYRDRRRLPAAATGNAPALSFNPGAKATNKPYLLTQADGAITLELPTTVVNRHKVLLQPPYAQLIYGKPLSALRDLLINILLFIPFGFCLYNALAWRHIPRALWLTIAAGAALSLSAELMQYYLPNRHSSVSDVIHNVVSTLFGAQLVKFASRRLPVALRQRLALATPDAK